MNVETLKQAVIHAINLGQADPFLQSICDCVGSLASDLETVESATFDLSLAVRQLTLAHRQHVTEMVEYRKENEVYARAQEAREAAEDRILSGKFTDEEGALEYLEAHRHLPQRKAA